MNRDVYQAQLREAITQAAPFIQGPRQINFLMKILFGTYDVRGIEQVFADETPELAMQVLQLINAFMTGQANLADPAQAEQLLESVSELCQSIVTGAEIDQVAQRAMKSPAPENQRPRGGTVQRGRSAGHLAHAEAQGQGRSGAGAAGAIGGMN
jgi:hypothetical protein